MFEREPGLGGPTQASQLAELLACERELAELLTAAEEEAWRLVQEARAVAATAAADIEASLGAEAERARSAIREATQRKVREIHGEARERAMAYEAVSDEEVARLGEVAFRALIVPEAEP
jgi:vacuolar-type H+-ATPase subunit E/Vma4